MACLTLRQFSTSLLEPFDLEVAAGECVSLSGPSGCGKTRLLRAIADLDPNQGSASIDGTQQSDLSGPQWRQRVGLLPAESFWWGEHVAEHFFNLDEAILGALGFPTDCGEWTIARLSTGEKQRLALARLLINRPQALLLDEPTANLDRENTARVEQLIQTWRSEHACAVIWISHDPAQQGRIAQRHFQIESGKLQALSWS